MGVVIGILADAHVARALVRSWLAAGCPAARLHLFVGAGVALDETPPSAPPLPLVRLAGHGSLALWALEMPAAERCRSTRRGRRARRALRLYGRLVAAEATRSWPAHARALAAGRPLGVAWLARTEPDLAALVRPLLAHAVSPVRVCDLARP